MRATTMVPQPPHFMNPATAEHHNYRPQNFGVSPLCIYFARRSFCRISVFIIFPTKKLPNSSPSFRVFLFLSLTEFKRCAFVEAGMIALA